MSNSFLGANFVDYWAGVGKVLSDVGQLSLTSFMQRLPAFVDLDA